MHRRSQTGPTKVRPLIVTLALCWSAQSCAPTPASRPPERPAPAPSMALARIDSIALAAPRSAESSPRVLAAYLTRNASTELEKVRAIYRWITDRVAYDWPAFVSGNYGDLSPEAVLRSRRTVCWGYTALFQRLAELAGLQAAVVEGYARSADHEPGTAFARPNHAWMAVRIDGEWRLIDPSWGAGYIQGGAFVRRFEDFWFLTPPTQMLFTHLPAESRWQLARPALTMAEFRAQPVIDAAYFRLGFDPVALRAASRSGGQALVRVNEAGGGVRVLAAPLAGTLRPGATPAIRLSAPGDARVALVNNDTWTYLDAHAGVYEGSVQARPGRFSVDVRLPGEVAYVPILVYRVDAER